MQKKWSVFLCVSVIFAGFVSVGRVIEQNVKYYNNVSETLTPIEQVIGTLDPSPGNLHGKVYSMDGVSMLQCIDLMTGENIIGKKCIANARLYCATHQYFSPVIGYDYAAEKMEDCISSGMLSEKEIQNILKSNALYSNRKSVEGDSIVTTIYSPAQEEAVNQLKRFGQQGDGEIAVVNEDGAILVNAASVSDEQVEFQNDKTEYIKNNTDEPTYYITNKNAFHAAAVGSSFKPLTARILEQNDKLLPKAWSIYRSNFDDVSEITVKEVQVKNWEMISDVKPENYYTDYDGSKFHRSSDLKSAFIHSSNTYFLRHANQLGLDHYQELLNDNLHLYDKYSIGGFELDGLLEYEQERFKSKDAYMVNLPYGNTAILSPVRLASAYNHALSGKFYLPFEIAQIRDPNGTILFQYQPEERKEYRLKIDVSDDIVVEGLKNTFQSYITKADGSYEKTFQEFSEKLLASGRLLAKSGTAGVDSGHENRTMALTILNKEQTFVICTAVMAVNNVEKNSIKNSELLYRLLKVLEKLEVYE